MAEIIFWISIFSIFYAFAGYPLLIWVLSKSVNKPVLRRDFTPQVSIVISVFNEEKIVREKIENSLALYYPEEKLEIAVISDGSTDGTNEIITEYAMKNNCVRKYISDENIGKTACLNRFVPQLKGDIVIFTDANSFFGKNLIRRIVPPFADNTIGFVTGSTKYVSKLGNDSIEVTGIYTKIEQMVKAAESRLGSCVGADGAIFAIRKELFVPLHPNDINDLVIPFKIIEQGHRGILEQGVFCREEEGKGMDKEFRRQVRITTRTLRAIFKHINLLNVFDYPLFSYALFSHKIMKFLSPFFLFLILLSNLTIVTATDHHLQILYVVTFGLQLLLYALATVSMILKNQKIGNRIVSLCNGFFMVNAAYLIGWKKLLAGETFVSWSPER